MFEDRSIILACLLDSSKTSKILPGSTAATIQHGQTSNIEHLLERTRIGDAILYHEF